MSQSIKGLLIALCIIGTWLGSLVFLLTLSLATLHPAWVGLFMIFQIFLYTGLFITAHDAMHGSVCRHWRGVNNAVGYIAVALYALFSYNKLWHKHWEHHRYVATPNADPDFHDGEHVGFAGWYAHFLWNYIGWQQLVGMAFVFNFLHHLAGIPLPNLLLFWVAPALLSTVQLFTFGTYLPHNEPLGGHTNRHRSNASNFNVFLSFLTCYHFGYHYEHHDAPATPWWRLPALHQQMRSLTSDNSMRKFGC